MRVRPRFRSNAVELSGSRRATCSDGSALGGHCGGCSRGCIQNARAPRYRDFYPCLLTYFSGRYSRPIENVASAGRGRVFDPGFPRCMVFHVSGGGSSISGENTSPHPDRFSYSMVSLPIELGLALVYPLRRLRPAAVTSRTKLAHR